jgi:predicted Zn-dependent protease with MMP-like domain/Tfp pilus assembly protein PilF
MAASDPVDRGWERLEAGDLPGARAALRKAEQGRKNDPEVLCLAGAIAAADGEVDAALELLARAAKADPEYAHPLLQAGELELYSRGDPHAALELAARALAAAEGEEERADALLLKAEAELEIGCGHDHDHDHDGGHGHHGGEHPPGDHDHDAAARATMAEIAALELRDPIVLTRAGQMYMALDDTRQAEACFLRAIDEDPGQADAHHGLGLIYEDRGDREAMVRAWQDTLRLDRAAPPPPWHMTPSEFEEVAEDAMGELPDEVLTRLENVPVMIDDLPSDDLIAEGYDPRLLGLFSGVPLPEKSHVSGQRPTIDSVHLYQKNLERQSADREELADQIRITVLHETAHFFGLEDEDLEEIGLG